MDKKALIARFGGDEFFILANQTDNINIKVKDILEEISKPIKIKDYTLNITASIGVAIYPKDGRNIEELLKNSDAAMFLAKSRGRNRVELYNKEITRDLNERLAIENALKEAIKNDDLLYYSHLKCPQIPPSL